MPIPASSSQHLPASRLRLFRAIVPFDDGRTFASFRTTVHTLSIYLLSECLPTPRAALIEEGVDRQRPSPRSSSQNGNGFEGHVVVVKLKSVRARSVTVVVVVVFKFDYMEKLKERMQAFRTCVRARPRHHGRNELTDSKSSAQLRGRTTAVVMAIFRFQAEGEKERGMDLRSFGGGWREGASFRRSLTDARVRTGAS